MQDADFVFICVGTPSAVDGEADFEICASSRPNYRREMTKPLIVVNKSTVPEWEQAIGQPRLSVRPAIFFCLLFFFYIFFFFHIC
ncbi:MAG: hypothetical protein Q9P01_05255 [Anaerolineae bacterium]|nr:hypothetical protein [Anaerolineae bacterium]